MAWSPVLTLPAVRTDENTPGTIRAPGPKTLPHIDSRPPDRHQRAVTLIDLFGKATMIVLPASAG